MVDLPRRPVGGLAVTDLFPGRLVGAELPYLGLRIDDDVGVQWISSRVVLVIGLGFEEGLQRYHLGDDRPVENMSRVQLVDIGVSDALLFVVGVEDRRAVLPAGVGALTVQLRRIVRDGEKDSQDLSVGDPARVVYDLDGLGVVRAASRDGLIVGGVGGAGIVGSAASKYR